MSVRICVLALLAGVQAWAAYSAKATVSFAAASGSGTDTNITLYFTGNDTKLKTSANGGLIQHTVTHGGITVPADLILTNDTTCASQTGSYTWGFKRYSATAGTFVGRAMIPSLTTGAAVVPTVCIGNNAVSTYQGGSTEFDTNVKGCWDFPDGTTLSATDCSSSANNGTLTNTPTASAGHVGGGAATFASASSQFVGITGNPAALQITGQLTVEMWLNMTSLPASSNLYIAIGKDDTAGTRAWDLYVFNDGSSTTLSGAVWTTSAPTTANLFNVTTALSANTWYYGAITFDGSGNCFAYLNGVAGGGLAAPNATMNNPSANVNIAARANGGGTTDYFNGQIENVRISATARTAGWLLTSYNNQNSAPAVGAFTLLAVPFSRAFIF